MDGDGKDPTAVDEEEVDKNKDADISSSEEEESEDEEAKKKETQSHVQTGLGLDVVGAEEITELTVPGIDLKLQRCAITADCDLFGEPSFDFYRSKDVHLYYGSYFKNQAIAVVIRDCFDLISESDNNIKIASIPMRQLIW